MTKERGGNKKGKESPRCLDNTGPRKFLVVEFDFKASEERLVQRPDISGVVGRLAASGITSLDMCAALLWHLSKFKHLAMVVHSGGKSLHGWFACAGESEENLRSFMQEAVRLGADKATWNPCQAVRMPGGTRFPQRVQQSVYYFNPL